MKFKRVNPHNFEWLIPPWVQEPMALARDIDILLDKYLSGRVLHFDSYLRFWIDLDSNGDTWKARIATPLSTDDEIINGFINFNCEKWHVSVPLNPLLKGCPDIDSTKSNGTHSLYIHTFDAEVPLPYVGVTKQRWFDRLAQHESAARCNSPFLFHRAIRDHAGKKIYHRVMFTEISYDTAMKLEESWVEMMGLYPLGLNMIPGGFAGLKYLHTLGINAKTVAERDAEVERAAGEEFIDGRANPLCAARWAMDQDFINRIICGHSGRLTTDQVRKIKMLTAVGKSAESIAESVNDNAERVSRVIRGKRYGRVV